MRTERSARANRIPASNAFDFARCALRHRQRWYALDTWAAGSAIGRLPIDTKTDDRRLLELDEDLSRFLNRLRPSAGETVAWFGGRMPLRVATYLSSEQPPLAYITSVRALLLRDNMVMTVRDAGGTIHLLPGGRREDGETLEQTLRREIREETGWSIGRLMPVGFLHYHHEAAIPKNYAYPYPDFVQAVYEAQADEFDEAGRENDGHELDVRFRSFEEALRMPVSLGNRVFLRAVMAQQSPVRGRG